MSTLASIGAAVRAARKQKKLSAREVLDSARLSHVTLRELETGLGNSRLSTLLAVCDALGLDVVLTPREVSDLIAGDDAPRSTELSDIIRETELSGAHHVSRKPA